MGYGCAYPYGSSYLDGLGVTLLAAVEDAQDDDAVGAVGITKNVGPTHDRKDQLANPLSRIGRPNSGYSLRTSARFKISTPMRRAKAG